MEDKGGTKMEDKGGTKVEDGGVTKMEDGGDKDRGLSSASSIFISPIFPHNVPS